MDVTSKNTYQLDWEVQGQLCNLQKVKYDFMMSRFAKRFLRNAADIEKPGAHISVVSL